MPTQMPEPAPPGATASAAVPPAEAVTPLLRGVAVLLCLTEAGGRLSPSGLEHATGLARSTVDRITTTLARTGYVRLDGRDAVLTPRVMELGNAYLAALRVPALLNPQADALADELDESVSLAVADRDGIRFIHQATRRRAMSLSFRMGDLLPAERTAPGPLFATEWTEDDWQTWRSRRQSDPQDRTFPAVPALATATAAPPPPRTTRSFEARTEEARTNDWSLDDQLIEPGLVAVGVPVRHPGTRRIVCVANVVSHTSRHTAEELRETLLPRLQAAAGAMERTLAETGTEAKSPPPPQEPPPVNLAAWTSASKRELGRDFIESLARGLTVLTVFGEDRAELTLSAVAKATGLARATARRALITYVHLGLVEKEAEAFRLTPRVLALGYPPLSRTTLPALAAPHLRELTARIQESTALAVAAPPDVRYTTWVPAPHVMSVHMPPGTRLPAQATAAGRILAPPPAPAAASSVPYAMVEDELEKGLRAMAVPIHDRAGRTVAAVSTAMHTARRTAQECVTDILPALLTTASRITADLHAASRFQTVPRS
ncbi:helix-turn-helix domain-containing protein [Streptomyces sp. NPDC047000]|uniref:IclR family transcriptional regulator domain-containing protein n=1 Tax=Streptomyces sp. NPDC047000 TaxID=3155474 RepID=UPI0033F3633E